jgi:hypothetical protein
MLKKKEFFAILFVFLSLKAVKSCKQLWDNSCTSNNECCTKFCDNNNGQWAAGVCKTRSGNDGDRGDDDNGGDNNNGDDNNNGNDNSGCKPLWDNSCTSNNECCTKFCDNNNGQWAAGVCKTRSGNDGDRGDDDNGGDNNNGDDNNNGNDNSGCKPLWDNSCTSNNECCTKFCDNNNGQWAAGVCKTRSGNDGDRGDDDNGGDNNNGDDNNNGNDNSGCKPLWDNSCTSNNECCTKFCDNNNGQWAAGVCKTRSGNDGDRGDDDNGGDNNNGDDNNNGNDNSGCKPLWDNSCTSNNECCTKFCDNNNGQWAAGVCKTRSGNDGDRGDDDNGGDNNNGDDNNNGNDNSGCKPLWDNSCTSNNECCTKFCDNNNGQWAAGVCKTRSGNDGDGDDNKPDNGNGDDDNGNGDNNGSGDDDNKNGNDNDDSGGDDNEPSSNSLINQSQFKNAVVSNGYSQPSSTIYNNFVKLAVSVGKIKTKSELGMFLAHTLHETDGFKAMREYYCYPTFNSGCAYSSGVGIAGKNYFGRGYLQLVS